MGNEPKIVEALRSKVEGYLRQKGLNFQVRTDGTLWVPQGSTVVVVRPTQWGENQQTLVKLAAPVALEIKKISPELTRFIAVTNNQLLFGKFSLDEANKTVWYEHVLLGDYLDIEELFTSVAAVAVTADKYDEEVSKMSRGKRFADL